MPYSAAARARETKIEYAGQLTKSMLRSILIDSKKEFFPTIRSRGTYYRYPLFLFIK